MSLILNTDKDLEVKKHEAVVNARYKLNPLSLKFITTLIAGIKKSDGQNKEYFFKIKDFGELLGLKRKDLHKAIKEAVKELLDKPLCIPIGKGNDKDSFLMLNWISSAEYKTGEGILLFQISPKLRPYLLDAKEKYLKYKLVNILSLKSSYTIRMYEILKDCLETNSKYGRKAELKIKVADLREKLGVPKSYQYSSHIKKLILEKAKKEF